MSVTSNKFLNKIQQISDESGRNNVTDISEALQTVLRVPNTVFFSDMAYFVILLYPPSGSHIGK